MTRVAVLGCGYWGPNLIRNFFKVRDCETVAVSDLRPERLDHIGQNYPGLRTTTDAHELLADSDIDAVAVVTPVQSHYMLAKAALEGGKHVLLAKPMTATVEQGEELVELADRHNRVLMVDHTFVYSGPVRMLRQLIDRGELGEIHYFDSVRVNLGLFQHDVNVLWDLAPHDISIFSYLIDKDPVAVSAIGVKPVNGGNYHHESIAYVTLHFDDETIAHVHVSWLSPVKVRRTLIGGSRQMLMYDHLAHDEQIKVYNMGVKLRSTEEQYEALVQYRIGDMHAPKVDQTEALEVECQHFIECIENGGQPITDATSGLEVVRLLETAQKSMENDGRAIPVEAITVGSGQQ